MALTLGQGAQFVASVGYNNRVKMAMVQAAVDVAAETQGSLSATVWSKRRLLATKILNNPDSTLTSFVAAVGADPSGGLSWFAPVNISSSTNANPTVITTAVVHGMSTGDVVEIAGSVVNTNANGTWVVTVVTTTTFSIPQAANGVGTAGGTAMKMIIDNDLLFTVNAVFNAVAGIMPGD